ncbi:hypothetical protein ACQ859_21475 [Roseateles chitinivorans]
MGSVVGRALLIVLASGIGAMILTAPVWSEDNASAASPSGATFCDSAS